MGKAKKDITRLRKKSEPRRKRHSSARYPKSTSPIQFLPRPPMAAIEPPPGFRVVGQAQAMIEYGAPILELLTDADPKALNEAMMLVQFCWNCGLPSTPKKASFESKEIREKLIALTAQKFKIEPSKAEELIEMMIKRKEYLLPFNIQPKIPLIMFIRKEKSYQISRFNYKSLKLSTNEYLPNNDDKKLVQLIEKLDKLIEIEQEYSQIEKHYNKVEDLCLAGFGRWLDNKKVEHGMIDQFLFNIQIYMNFIYQYGHNTECNLKTASEEHIVEFFSDHVLRKATVDPPKYSLWPPAMKLFYQFLENIGYLKNAGIIVKLIDRIEPIFIKILQKMYA